MCISFHAFTPCLGELLLCNLEGHQQSRLRRARHARSWSICVSNARRDRWPCTCTHLHNPSLSPLLALVHGHLHPIYIRAGWPEAWRALGRSAGCVLSAERADGPLFHPC
eukprot:1151715-Pelagomonas_calceolata.AAC.4